VLEGEENVFGSESLLVEGLTRAEKSYSNDAVSDKLELTLRSSSCSVKSVPLGKQNLDGQEVDLPPVLLGEYGSDPKKKTILVYGQSTSLAPSKLLELT